MTHRLVKLFGFVKRCDLITGKLHVKFAIFLYSYFIFFFAVYREIILLQFAYIFGTMSMFMEQKTSNHASAKQANEKLRNSEIIFAVVLSPNIA